MTITDSLPGPSISADAFAFDTNADASLGLDLPAYSLATAFEAAINDDAQKVRRINSTGCHDASCCYYMISLAWMNEFLLFAFSGDKPRPGKMVNMPLLLASDDSPHPEVLTPCTHFNQSNNVEIKSSHLIVDSLSDKIDDAEEHERRRKLRRQKWAQKQVNSQDGERMSILQKNLVHDVNYVLAGESTWTLLSCKFGFDECIPLEARFCLDSEKEDADIKPFGLTVIIYGCSASENGSQIAGSLVPIPPSGAFKYTESYFSVRNGCETFPGNDGISDSYCDDLFKNEEQSVSHVNNVGAPIILLPPSTNALSTERQVAVVSLDENCSSSVNGRCSNYDIEDYTNDKNGVELHSDWEHKEEEPKSSKRKRVSSGLGNLGNTCFMNSTLQCLAHTGPLRQYFISGEYENDLNRDNPLGTGGELASEFADLLAQMWGIQKETNNSRSLYCSPRNIYSSHTSDYHSSSVVYPRNFKYILGKHAEQFMGYDQHDCQELATYLLDALHEDTNRVTKKPYVQKLEKGENEPDEVASDMAWDLHLKRDDSRVLESFMGQMKSRVQCPRETCGRVSTTFDPFMYLSVPIPGATDRTLEIIHVPLNSSERMMKLKITLSKTSSIATLQQKIVFALNDSRQKDKSDNATDNNINANEIVLADVWNNEIYSFYAVGDSIDKIREKDITYSFHIASFRDLEEDIVENDDFEDISWTDRNSTIQLDCATISKLEKKSEWEKALGAYMKQPMTLYSLLNTKRSTHEERIRFCQTLNRNIGQFYNRSHAITGQDTANRNTLNPINTLNPSSETEGDIDADSSDVTLDVLTKKRTNSVDSPPLAERHNISTTFQNVNSIRDVAILELCARKFYQFSMSIFNEQKIKNMNGVVIQVVFKKYLSRNPVARASSTTFQSNQSTESEQTLCSPLLLRISPKLTVYGLRQIVGVRLRRALKTEESSCCHGDESINSRHTNQQAPFEAMSVCHESKEEHTNRMNGFSVDDDRSIADEERKRFSLPESSALEDEKSELDIMRQIPLTYERKSLYSYNKGHSSYRRLGALSKTEEEQLGLKPVIFAMPSDDAEQDVVSDLVGQHGTVCFHWPSVLSERVFDVNEWTTVDNDVTNEAEEADNIGKRPTVIDCIAKYCQMEQLEQTEMWYCNRCKDHVQAWKQFHLYRTPPILIVHLKRFYFSATSHRRDKIDTLIDFPLTGLDLTRAEMHWNEGQEPVYDCYAVSNHYGGLGGGHYTAYAQNDDGEWYCYDDSRVTKVVNEKDVVSSAAYVLYYRRRDVIFGNATRESPVPTIVNNQNWPLHMNTVENMDVEDPGLVSGSSSPMCPSPVDSIEGVGGMSTEELDEIEIGDSIAVLNSDSK